MLLERLEEGRAIELKFSEQPELDDGLQSFYPNSCGLAAEIFGEGVENASSAPSTSARPSEAE